MKTATGWSKTAYGPTSVNFPTPVTKMVMAEPGAAGFDFEFRVPSWFKMYPWPNPLLSTE